MVQSKMRRNHRILMVCWLVCGSGVLSSTTAQRLPDRGVTLNPLAPPMDGKDSGGVSWMHASGGWGEFGTYRMLRDDEHAWVQKLGAYIEMVRVADRASLAFVSNIEFIANPHNNIRFNPRAVFWEEGFLYTMKSGPHFWQLGYFHRCKHDVDNLGIGKERSLIFGSLQVKYLLPFETNGGATEGMVAIRSDIYTIRQDDRRPASAGGQLDLNRAIGSLAGLVHLRTQLASSIFGLYATIWSGFSAYSSHDGILSRFRSLDSATLNGGVSGGIAVHGNAHFRVGFTYEYLSDTGINPVPEHAHLLSFGVTILNPVSMW